MMNSLESYADAGRKAARATRNHDAATASHFSNWSNRAIRLESESDRTLAMKAYADAYRAESGFVPFK